MIEIADYLQSPTCWSLFFASLFASAALTPGVMILARRLGAVDQGGHRRVYEGSMPLLGGLGIALPFAAACLLGLTDVTGMFAFVEPMRAQFLVMGIGSVAIVALGIFDDIRGLRARYKLLFQILVALLVVLSGEVLTVVRLPLLGTMEVSPGIGMFVGLVWIVGLINAFNIIDGIDGLAASIALIATVGLLALAAIGHYTFVVLLCVPLAGSLLGFIPYNLHPAKIFLGDTGSMFLGFALSSITLMGTYKSETAVIVLAPLLALGFPIFETLLSMTRRLVRGAPVFGADDRHTHHRLLSRGYSQPRVVLLLCSVSAILTSVAIMTRIVPENAVWEWFSIGVVVVTLIGIVWIAGYLRVVPVTTVLERRELNARLQAFSRYAALSMRARKDPEHIEELLRLTCRELGLHCLAVESATQRSPARFQAGSCKQGPTETMRLKAVRGPDLRVEYAFAEEPDADHRRDVVACLARLFEGVELS